MYDSDYRGRMIAARGPRVAFINRPRPWTDGPAPVPSESGRATPMPVHPPRVPWSGNWRPRMLMNVREMGGLGEDIPTLPGTVPVVPQVQGFPTLQPNAPSTGSGWLSELFAGLGNIITPAAQAVVATKAAGVVAQQTQRTLAQTYNPALTAPAIQAQAWQTAYQSGAGAMPTASISGTTWALLGLGALGVYLIARR